MTAIEDITAERARQVAVEGFVPENDDKYQFGEMAFAAAAYASHAGNKNAQIDIRVGRRNVWSNGGWASIPRLLWPWGAVWWKPTTPRRDLVKAGALIVAEIERLDRLAAGAPQ